MMATAQVCAAIPNFLVQEWHWIDSPELWRNWVKEGEIIQKGFITMPERAGIGVEMNEEGARKAQVPGDAVVRADEKRVKKTMSTSRSFAIVMGALWATSSAFAQPGIFTRELLIKYTPDWKGERFADGRPKVPEGILRAHEIGDAGRSLGAIARPPGFNHEYEDGWLSIHPGKGAGWPRAHRAVAARPAGRRKR